MTEREINIPELDELYGQVDFKPWDEDSEAILRKYYNHVPFRILMKYFPDRTHNAVRCKVRSLGITMR